MVKSWMPGCGTVLQAGTRNLLLKDEAAESREGGRPPQTRARCSAGMLRASEGRLQPGLHRPVAGQRAGTEGRGGTVAKGRGKGTLRSGLAGAGEGTAS